MNLIVVFKTLLPYLMIGFGTIGNLVIFLVFSRKKFEKNSSQNLLRVLAVADTFALIMVQFQSETSFGENAAHISKFSCKLFDYLSFVSAGIASWITAFISIQRYISINYTNTNINFYTKKFWQTIILIGIILWNMVVYSERVYYLNLFQSENSFNNNTNNLTEDLNFYCDIQDNAIKKILATIDFLNWILIPFLIMIINSIMIIKSIYISRKKLLHRNLGAKTLAKYKQDIQFSITIISLNILFFLFNMPIGLYNMFEYKGNILDYLSGFILSLQYICNVLIYILLNKQFRNELIKMFNLRESNESNNEFSNSKSRNIKL